MNGVNAGPRSHAKSSRPRVHRRIRAEQTDSPRVRWCILRGCSRSALPFATPRPAPREAASQTLAVRSPLPVAIRCAVRRKRHGEDPFLVAFEGEQFVARGRVPHLGRLILTAGDNSPAIRGKIHRHDPTAVAFEGEQLLAAGCVPHLGRLIFTASDNPLAIRRKGRRENQERCPLRREQFLAVVRIPHRGILTASRLAVTIRRPSGENATDQIHMNVPFDRGEQFLAGGRVPNLAVPSSLPVAIRWPSGEKATDLTGALCPIRGNSSLRLATSQTLAVLSKLPVTIRWPSGEKAADRTERCALQE